MRVTRGAAAAGLLAVEAGLAALGVLVHHGLLAEYGDISHSTIEAWLSGFATGLGGFALVLVGVVGLVAALVTRRPRVRLVAAALPVLMVLGMLAVTPSALSEKLEQYDVTPRCVFPGESGPGARAARESQQAFESIEHVGYFGGGGGSGLGGCDRTVTLLEDVDVVQHYRTALPAAGWEVTQDTTGGLRAQRDGMAFEVSVCDGGGVVWAGDAGIRGVARCDAGSGVG